MSVTTIPREVIDEILIHYKFLLSDVTFRGRITYGYMSDMLHSAKGPHAIFKIWLLFYKYSHNDYPPVLIRRMDMICTLLDTIHGVGREIEHQMLVGGVPF